MDEISQLKEKLKDKYRRLTSGKLYNIKTKERGIVPFIPNEVQIKYIEERHTRNIIVKARQLGYSTMIQTDFFDDFLFNRNMNVGVIAQDTDSAIEIFRDKIRVLWDNLPKRLKDYYVVNTDRSNEISIENTGSKIRVATSFRGATLQRLHISEYGKICASYPEKAQEIKDGALEAVSTNNIIVIESTAAGAEGQFYEMSKKAKALQDEGKEPNELEYKLFFSPWWKEKGYALKGNIMIPQENQEYFEDLSNKDGIQTTTDQQNRWTMKKAEKGDGMFKEYPSTFNEAFFLTMKGAYYEREITTARLQRRIGRIMYDPQLLVHTVRDLGGAGGGDDTSIRFLQVYANEYRLIDFREGNGRGMIEILDTIIKTKRYQYGSFVGPHDMRVTEYSIGKDRWQIAKESGFTFEIMEKNSISDGINQVRQVFPKCWFDEEKCGKGVEMLSKYRRSRDESNGVRRDRPEHNGMSHCADSFRYLAQWILKEQKKQDRSANQAVIVRPDRNI